MKKLTMAWLVAGAAMVAAVQPADAAVFIGGFTLDTGTFGVQTGVHSDGEQSAPIVTGYVNQDNSDVTFSTTSGTIHINGQGEAVLDGDPLLENLTVVFEKAWNKVTFNFEGDDGAFNLLVNGAALFSSAGGGNCVDFCNIGNGSNQFVLSGTGISSLYFTFDPGIDTARQFRLDVPTSLPPVPEPATWAMLIAGLGMVGAQMRLRKPSVASA